MSILIPMQFVFGELFDTNENWILMPLGKINPKFKFT